MGQLVSKLYSVASREVKMYNIERRAEKVISKEKPTPAPLHPSSMKELKQLNEENVSKEHIHQKNIELDEHLKKVYVTTSDHVPPPMGRIENPNRPLPLKRYTDRELSYGYSESEELAVPAGKVSLKQALQFLSDHGTDPQQHTNTMIAAKYKLSSSATDDILKHFKMFSVRMNEKKELNTEQLSAYSRLQLKAKSMTFTNVAEVYKDMQDLMKAAKKEREVEELQSKEDGVGKNSVENVDEKSKINEKNIQLNNSRANKQDKG